MSTDAEPSPTRQVQLVNSELIMEELTKLDLGKALGREHLRRLSELGAMEDVPAGARILEAGEPASELRILLSGRVALQLEVPGQPERTIGTVNRGELLGWSALEQGATWTTHATALRASRSVLFPAEPLRELCSLDHELGYYLMRHAFRIVAHRLTDVRVRLLDVYAPPA